MHIFVQSKLSISFRAYLYDMILFFLESSPIRHGNGTGRPNSTETSCYDVFFFHQLFFMCGILVDVARQ